MVVEGHLLFSPEHAGAAALRRLCDHHVVLCANAGDATAMEALWRRKYERGRPTPYSARGVTPEAYRCWWDAYVWPRWLEHGERGIPPDAWRIDCHAPLDDTVARLVASGWFGEHGGDGTSTVAAPRPLHSSSWLAGGGRRRLLAALARRQRGSRAPAR